MTRYDEMPDLMTVDEVCRLLRLSKNTVYDMIRGKEIPSIKVGRQIRVPKRALIEKLEG